MVFRESAHSVIQTLNVSFDYIIFTTKIGLDAEAFGPKPNEKPALLQAFSNHAIPMGSFHKEHAAGQLPCSVFVENR